MRPPYRAVLVSAISDRRLTSSSIFSSRPVRRCGRYYRWDRRYGDSPYASYSAFAGNTLLISPERLVDEGLLDHADLKETPVGPVDYGYAHQLKDKILASAYQNFADAAH